MCVGIKPSCYFLSLHLPCCIKPSYSFCIFSALSPCKIVPTTFCMVLASNLRTVRSVPYPAKVMIRKNPAGGCIKPPYSFSCVHCPCAVMMVMVASPLYSSLLFFCDCSTPRCSSRAQVLKQRVQAAVLRARKEATGQDEQLRTQQLLGRDA